MFSPGFAPICRLICGNRCSAACVMRPAGAWHECIGLRCCHQKMRNKIACGAECRAGWDKAAAGGAALPSGGCVPGAQPTAGCLELGRRNIDENPLCAGGIGLEINPASWPALNTCRILLPAMVPVSPVKRECSERLQLPPQLYSARLYS